LNYRYIALCGCIGAGKSELAKMLCKNKAAKLIEEEFAHNSFLKKFYQKPERYAFPLEISFLFERFQQLNIELNKESIFEKHYVSDYYFDKSLIFASINLQEDQFRLFRTLFYNFREQLGQADLIIYLHRPIEILQKNIIKRGRTYESMIQKEYLESIQEQYLKYLKSKKKSRVLILRLENLDFMINDKLMNNIRSLTEVNHNFGYHIISF
jgi:deoxyguanosine kinase